MKPIRQKLLLQLTNLEFILCKFKIQSNLWDDEQKVTATILLNNIEAALNLYKKEALQFIARKDPSILQAAHAQFTDSCRNALENARGGLKSLSIWEHFQQSIIDSINSCIKWIQQVTGFSLVTLENIRPIPLQTIDALASDETLIQDTLSINLKP